MQEIRKKMEYRYTITNDPKKGILLINAQGDEVAATDILDKCSSARVFAFDGKMGAGKTTFIKHLCETMGTKDVVINFFTACYLIHINNCKCRTIHYILDRKSVV